MRWHFQGNLDSFRVGLVPIRKAVHRIRGLEVLASPLNLLEERGAEDCVEPPAVNDLIRHVLLCLWWNSDRNYEVRLSGLLGEHTDALGGLASSAYPHSSNALVCALLPFGCSWSCSVVVVKVTQSCPTLWDPMDYKVHGILQARILEWVAMPSSRWSSLPRDWILVSHIASGFFTSWATREAVAFMIIL